MFTDRNVGYEWESNQRPMALKEESLPTDGAFTVFDQFPFVLSGKFPGCDFMGEDRSINKTAYEEDDYDPRNT